jgi:hypothetical protein
LFTTTDSRPEQSEESNETPLPGVVLDYRCLRRVETADLDDSGNYLRVRDCRILDQRLAKKAREESIDKVMFGWEPSKDDPEYEDKGGLTRVRLTGKDQILAARIAELLRIR